MMLKDIFTIYPPNQKWGRHGVKYCAVYNSMSNNLVKFPF